MITDTSPKYSGEPTAKSLASGLATLGRYGDDYMVHAAEGETFVPKEILEANPELKENLFKQMTMMGIENPNRYVVGNELNSINPITGQPEFFFKKVFRAVKKVAKKVLPIAAPIIGNLIAPGIGGILASGLTTKLTGGTTADAFKSMLFSYVAQGAARGFSDGFSLGPESVGGQPSSFFTRLGGSSFSPTDFGTGLQQGLTEPFSALGNLASSGASNPLAQGIFGPRGLGGGIPGVFSSLKGTNFAKQPFGGGDGIMSKVFPSYQSGSALGSTGVNPSTSTSGPIQTSQQLELRTNMGRVRAEELGLKGEAADSFAQRWASTSGVGGVEPNFNEKISSFLTSDKPEEGILSALTRKTGETLSGGNLTGTGAKVLGGAALTGGALLAANALMPEEEAFDPSTLRTNMERKAYTDWQNIADKNSSEAESLRTVWYGKPRYSATQLASSFGANPLSGITAVAAGGEIMGPGTGTSDSIPAMLSDGEFVMTARAVRNAGNGDRDVGAARMYDMMNRFESGAA
tara:strand:+ start:42 stop:1598 length:1557 start_codon:yes stop_codon:yes gene_type:complete